MHDYEKLGLFYLGKRYDLAARTRLDAPVLYDSKDLLTHAMCVGMTGSGKTGLGIAVIEEAALDGVPVLAIDPKGDLANLLLTFPALSPDDFRPWVDTSTAGAQPIDTAAADAARTWSNGLADWDQDGARIARLRAAVDICVFTPGSRAATPLALLGTLAAPPGENEEDAAAWVTTTASSLLALAGLADTSSRGREHTLLSAILMHAGSQNSGGLPWLIQRIQRPDFDRVGVLDLETFYPSKERQELALQFNSVLAAPGFDVWLQGQPLDIGGLLVGPTGKPRIAIVSIAHLGDAERMLVVSLLLNAVLAWTRRQTGTSALRALIYLDEVFGYLPPVANPPSKLPLLTLLKQARAFGVGLMLATQNPVDLDYKALSNIGTWFLGKLQTERDKARVLDGIESIGAGVDKGTLDTMLSSLQKRVFFMHDVHEPEPLVFETRWTLSYLRGPMTRDELRRAVGPSRELDTQSVSPSSALPAPTIPPLPSTQRTTAPRPVLPAGIREYFLPGRDGATVYEPVLYGSARVHYTDARRGVDTVIDVHVATPFSAGPVPVDWNDGERVDIDPDALKTEPTGAAATFAALPSAALNPRSYASWTRDFEQWLVRTQPLRLFAAPSVKLTSTPGESERDFRARVQQRLRETRDQSIEKLRAKYAPKVARLAERARKAEEVVGREQQQVEQQRVQTAVSMGATLLGALMGRKAFSASTLGRATTTARSVGRSMKESQDVARAREKLEQVRAEQRELQAALDAEVAGLAGGAALAEPLATVEIKPKRGSVDVRLVALAWRS